MGEINVRLYKETVTCSGCEGKIINAAGYDELNSSNHYCYNCIDNGKQMLIKSTDEIRTLIWRPKDHNMFQKYIKEKL